MEEDILIIFGQKIRKLRKLNGWSQEDLAEKTGFHRTYIGMVERGERNVSLKNINVFATTFKVELTKLFEK